MNHVEHLVLKGQLAGFKFKYKTKYHEDLGNDLQGALDVLEREGWQVVAGFHDGTDGSTRLVLVRVNR